MAEAVIVVPGVMGSKLGYLDDSRIYNPVWYDLDYLLLYGPAVLQLDAAGIGPGPLASGLNVIVGGGFAWPPTFQALFYQLKNLGYEPVFWPYDFRKSLLIHAQALAQFLATNYSQQAFRVIGYSMGGLIARLAYPLFRAMGPNTVWQRTVYVGVPQNGSYEATHYLALSPALLGLTGLLGTNLIGNALDRLTPTLLSIRLDVARQVLATWPGLYELMPNPNSPWNVSDPLSPQIYSTATWADSNKYVTPQRMTAARITWDALDATATQPRAVERTVVGNGLDTPTKLGRASNLNQAYSYDVSPGDRAVVPSRAHLAGAPDSLFLNGVAHLDLLNDGDLLRALDGLLSGVDTTTVTIPAQLQGPRGIPAAPLLYTIPFEGNPGRQRIGDP